MSRKHSLLLLALLLLFVMACTLTASPSPEITSNPAGTLFTKPLNVPTKTTTQERETCQVIAQHLNLRTCAGTDCAVINVIDNGQTLEIIERGHWHNVQTNTGQAGYINSNYCKIGE